MPKACRSRHPSLVTSRSCRWPQISHTSSLGGWASASAVQLRTFCSRTVVPNVERSLLMEDLTSSGRNTVRHMQLWARSSPYASQHLRENALWSTASSKNWFRSFGGVWKKPAVELAGEVIRAMGKSLVVFTPDVCGLPFAITWKGNNQLWHVVD